MREFSGRCGGRFELCGPGGGDGLADRFGLAVFEWVPLSIEMKVLDEPIARDYGAEMGNKMRVLGGTVADRAGMVNRMYVAKGRSSGPLRASK